MLGDPVRMYYPVWGKCILSSIHILYVTGEFPHSCIQKFPAMTSEWSSMVIQTFLVLINTYNSITIFHIQIGRRFMLSDFQLSYKSGIKDIGDMDDEYCPGNAWYSNGNHSGVGSNSLSLSRHRVFARCIHIMISRSSGRLKCSGGHKAARARHVSPSREPMFTDVADYLQHTDYN